MRIAAVFITSILVFGATVSHARTPEQPVLGSLIPDRRPAEFDSDAAMAIGREMAACVVRQNASSAGEFVLALGRQMAPVTYKQINSALNYCIGATTSGNARQMRFGDRDLKGLIAEALLRRKMPPLVGIAATPGQYRENWVSTDAVIGALEQTAVCVGRVQPEVAQRLIASEPGSAGETIAVGEVTPVLRLCIAPDAGFKSSKAGIRLTLASAIYHRAYDTPAPIAASSVGKN